MGLGKKHKIKEDIKNFQHLIIGDKKIGKTGLTAEIAEEIYGDIEKLLIISIGKEKAHEAIDGSLFEEPKTWKDVMNIAKEMVKMVQNNEWDFDLVSWDTIDELLPIMEKEVIRLHTVEYKEKPKGFNACFGGYNNPKDKVRELVNELMSLMDIVAEHSAIFWIGHNKVRPIKTKLDTEDYYVVSSNLAFDYFNMFAYKTPIICNIIKEVATADTGKTTGIGANKKAVNVATSRDRQMYFRDSGAVEAGGRFKEMPEKVDYGAQNYYDAVIEGIKSSKKRSGQKKVVEEVKQEDIIEPSVSTQEDTIEPLARVDELLRVSKEVADSGVSNKVIMDIYKDHGIQNPKEFTDYKLTEKAIQDLKSLL